MRYRGAVVLDTYGVIERRSHDHQDQADQSDTAGVSLRVAEGRLRLDLDGFFIRFPLFGEAFYRRTLDG